MGTFTFFNKQAYQSKVQAPVCFGVFHWYLRGLWRGHMSIGIGFCQGPLWWKKNPTLSDSCEKEWKTGKKIKTTVILSVSFYECILDYILCFGECLLKGFCFWWQNCNVKKRFWQKWEQKILIFGFWILLFWFYWSSSGFFLLVCAHVNAGLTELRLYFSKVIVMYM